MDEKILKLKLSLEEKTPTLLLGAGFSYCAVNINGDELPLGEKLVEKLYQHMFKENPPCKEVMDEDGAGAKHYKDENDLKGLCGLLRDEGRVNERNSYLTSVFTGASIEDESKLFNITNYKWNKIFTLNIDCLLEYIFEKSGVPFKVWNRDNDDRRNNNSDALIIKLHGCVNNSSVGYIFDDKEYMDFWNDDDCFSRDFGDAYSKGDMIFIGTEFQEDDLKTIINKYSSKGYNSSGNNYFFISPEIHNVRLKRQILSTDNYYWIPWTTEQFFDFLHKEVILEKDTKKILQEKGLIVIDDLYKNRIRDYESKLFAGYESLYNDFFEDWDIIHPGLVQFEEKIINRKKNIVAAVLGKSYVGKSCAAKRVLVDFRKNGFLTFEFNMRSSEYMQLFLKYLEQLPENTKVAVLFEEASFYYSLIYTYLIRKCPNNIKQLVVVTSDTIGNYSAKRDILEGNDSIEKFMIDEKISWNFADKIYQKLKEKRWLNKPEISGSDKDDLKRYACKINDIIEFLYNISHGYGFEAHYADMFTMMDKDINFKYLQALAIMEILGLGSIPVRILPALIKSERSRFNFKNFNKKFDEILLISDHRIKIRCLRLIHKAIIINVEEKDIKDILKEIVRQTYGQFNEGDINDRSEIFQKALTVKRILKEKLLSLSMIRELLNEVERYGERYSFYWIQRGIAAQKDNQFDLADHYFREGIRINPSSYQAHHAMAKNLMERAVEQVKNGEFSYAPYYMDEGVKEMKNIIDNPAYSRGYKYSLHALIDMSIKYYDTTGKIINAEDIRYMQERIMLIPDHEIDLYIIEGIKKYISYCQNHKYEVYCESIIMKHYEKLPNIKNASAEDYLVENLDWED